MTKPHRQRYGLGSFIKKAARKVKKVFKSPLGKAALLGGAAWGLGGLGGATGMARFSPSAWKSGLGAIRNNPRNGNFIWKCRWTKKYVWETRLVFWSKEGT